MSKILVTGGSGFIGSHLLQQIDAKNIDLKEGNNILSCDLPEADVVIHLAAQSRVIPSVENPAYDAMTNIVGTVRLLTQYKNARFIFASSEGATQQPIEAPYGLSKQCAEEYIKFLHNDYVILRLPNIYGHPDSGSVVDIFCNEPALTIYGDGTQTRDYVHVLDIVEAIKQSLEWPKGTYHVASGRFHSVLELANATNKPVVFAPKRPGEKEHVYTRNTTPWKPTLDVLDYIRSHV
jgi:UDP-glucose 4-epimerase